MNLQVHRLAPTESRVSGETDKLCIESHSSVFVLVTAVIAAAIRHSEFLITLPLRERFHVSRIE